MAMTASAEGGNSIPKSGPNPVSKDCEDLCLGLPVFFGPWTHFRTGKEPIHADPIELTDKERMLFDLLLQVTRRFHLDIEIGIAGGWVHDKLLGRQRTSHRIEVVVDNMNGKEFCEKVNDYLSDLGEITRKITVIRNKSFRRLERVRMSLFDMRVDFVELRSEVFYAHCSRRSVPRVFYSVEESLRHFWIRDATLRDFTINSLFYNVKTKSVVDFTERGMRDLKSGKLMTPLNPKTTLLGDPVRVFRGIRLGTSLGFELDEELRAAALDSDVKAVIREPFWRKIIGHEVNLMIYAKDNQPVEAIRMICDLQLFWDVFDVDPYCFSGLVLPPIPDVFDLDKLCVNYMDDAWKLMQQLGFSTFNEEQRRLALYAALFLPLRERKRVDQAAICFLFQKSPLLKSSDCKKVRSLQWYAGKFVALIPSFLAIDVPKQPADYYRDDGDDNFLTLMILPVVRDLWRILLLLSTLLYRSTDEANCSLEDCLKIFQKVEGLIVNLSLHNIWKVKPLLNGKDILSMFCVGFGPFVGRMKMKSLHWQLAHPSGTAEDCRIWMRKSFQRLARDKIELTDDEEMLFDFLFQVARHCQLNIEIGIAGGWVHDKLLGRQRTSHHIEVVVDMNGKEFCEKVNDYMSDLMGITRKITVIRNKSFRRLEKARMSLLNMRIDFVELRSEVFNVEGSSSSFPGVFYAGNASQKVDRYFSGRNPRDIWVRFATLRDFTINNLFYNIKTESVVDFTGRGMRDLKSGKLMTPLNPKTTLLGDPIRVFRGIRLATSLGFELDEELRAAAFDSDVKAVIRHPFWRETIGHEVNLMTYAKDNQPVEAIRMICDLQLFWDVFNVDPHRFCGLLLPPIPDVLDLDKLCVNYMDDAWKLVQKVGFSTFNQEQRRLALYAALFLPLRVRKRVDQAAGSFLFEKSLLLKSSDGKKVRSLQWYAGEFVALIPSFLAIDVPKQPPADYYRNDGDKTFLTLREMAGIILHKIGDLWRVLLLLSTLLYQSTDDVTAANRSLEGCLYIFHKVEGLIEKMFLVNIWKVKPLLNGKDIFRMFSVGSEPLVAQMKIEALRWQLAHPSGTAEDCRIWMRKKFQRLAVHSTS